MCLQLEILRVAFASYFYVRVIVVIFLTILVTCLFLPLCFPAMKIKNKNQFFNFKNISIFYLWRVALYFKGMPNKIEFHKGIVLQVIPVSIAVYELKVSKKNSGTFYKNFICYP